MKQTRKKIVGLVAAGVATIALGGLTLMAPSAAKADSTDYGHSHHFVRDHHFDRDHGYWSNGYYYDGYGHRYDRDEYNRHFGRDHRYNDRNDQVHHGWR